MINVITASQSQALEQYASAGGVATQSFTAIRTITALNLQPYFLSQYRKYLIDALDVGILKGLKVGFGNGLMFGVYYLVYALGFWYGGELVATSVEDECTRNCTTGGIVVSVFFSITMGAEALGQIAPPLTANTAARGAIVKVLEIIRRKPKIESKQLSTSHRQDAKLGGQISFENVGFAYPSRPDVKVCESLSLSINAGETVALVGSSGSGKVCFFLYLLFSSPSLHLTL
jgi:ATP-binding cassette subfamily B (MDR/TAP) protein 1